MGVEVSLFAMTVIGVPRGVQASHRCCKVLLWAFAHTPLPGVPSHCWLLFIHPHPLFQPPIRAALAQSLLLCFYSMEAHSRFLFAHHGFLDVKAKAYSSSCGRAPSPGPV